MSKKAAVFIWVDTAIIARKKILAFFSWEDVLAAGIAKLETDSKPEPKKEVDFGIETI